jgi:3'-phosphoadenosine 5'-phosphosulfate sulfotransferase (PAPS reductase)/FAD synthetase
MSAGTRYLAWFSAGAASAVATKLSLSLYDDVTIYRTDVGSEHPDNERFSADCAEWFGQEVRTIKVEKYADTWQVWEERRYLVGPTGALCTTELKKKARYMVERDYDAQIFGYTADRLDTIRATRFRDTNPDVTLLTPLIDRGLTKSDCLAMIERASIELPAMYKLGYRNNNCIPCVKGGMGYQNKIRRDFPEAFDRLAKLERKLGHTVLRDNGEPLYLDELDPERGNHDDEPDIECSLMCTSEFVLSDGAMKSGAGRPHGKPRAVREVGSESHELTNRGGKTVCVFCGRTWAEIDAEVRAS